MQVVVIGAGVVGTAAAAALIDSGHTVALCDPEPGHHQSAGPNRIFRLCHSSPELVTVAREAASRWRAWEAASGLHLLGSEGLVVTGSGVAKRAAAMRAAGAAVVTATAALPWQPAGLTAADALLAPAAGAIRSQRTMEMLLARTSPAHRAECVRHLDWARGQVETDSGTLIADAIVIAAGTATDDLLGSNAPAPVAHSRFSYARTPGAGPTPPCWIDTDLHVYGLPVGSTGHYAVGWTGPADLDPDRVSRRTRDRLAPIIAEQLPQFASAPCDELRCRPRPSPFDDGDGWSITRHGAALAVRGGNLFKFAPVIADRLRIAAESGSDGTTAAGTGAASGV